MNPVIHCWMRSCVLHDRPMISAVHVSKVHQVPMANPVGMVILVVQAMMAVLVLPDVMLNQLNEFATFPSNVLAKLTPDLVDHRDLPAVTVDPVTMAHPVVMDALDHKESPDPMDPPVNLDAPDRKAHLDRTVSCAPAVVPHPDVPVSLAELVLVVLPDNLAVPAKTVTTVNPDDKAHLANLAILVNQVNPDYPVTPATTVNVAAVTIVHLLVWHLDTK